MCLFIVRGTWKSASFLGSVWRLKGRWAPPSYPLPLLRLIPFSSWKLLLGKNISSRGWRL